MSHGRKACRIIIIKYSCRWFRKFRILPYPDFFKFTPFLSLKFIARKCWIAKIYRKHSANLISWWATLKRTTRSVGNVIFFFPDQQCDGQEWSTSKLTKWGNCAVRCVRLAAAIAGEWIPTLTFSLVCPSTLTSYLYTRVVRVCDRATGGIYA